MFGRLEAVDTLPLPAKFAKKPPISPTKGPKGLKKKKGRRCQSAQLRSTSKENIIIIKFINIITKNALIILIIKIINKKFNY